MKRIIAILLMLLLLAACQPTPDHDYVINKGDDIVEQKLSATPVPAQPIEDAVGVDNKTEAPTGETEGPKAAAALTPQTFPDRWDEDTEKISDHLTIAVHADVVQRADGKGTQSIWTGGNGQAQLLLYRKKITLRNKWQWELVDTITAEDVRLQYGK